MAVIATGDLVFGLDAPYRGILESVFSNHLGQVCYVVHGQVYSHDWYGIYRRFFVGQHGWIYSNCQLALYCFMEWGISLSAPKLEVQITQINSIDRGHQLYLEAWIEGQWRELPFPFQIDELHGVNPWHEVPKERAIALYRPDNHPQKPHDCLQSQKN